MADFDVDLFVIGGGSGGVRAARIAGALGARVALAESGHLGGTCVNVGCVPKKLLVYASRFGSDAEDAAGFGWRVTPPEPHWPTLIARKDAEIRRLNGVYAKLLEQAGVELIEGHARFASPHELEVTGRRVRARHVVIATGGWPYVPEVVGAELAITSNDAFHLSELPRRPLIVGGGYIALEFAGIFQGLGAEVALVVRGDRVLRGFDADVRDTVAREMVARGIDLRVGDHVETIERTPAGLEVRLAEGKTLLRDLVMFATGRTPNTANLGLDTVGVDLGPRGEVKVDDLGRTNVEHVYAVGDVTDRITLTPMALAEGEAVARTLFGEAPVRVDHDDVPSAVFSQPPVGTVGLTEEQARERFASVRIYRSTFRPLKHTLSGRDEQAMMKLVVDADSDRVLGCHMVGDEAGEIIQGLAVALKLGVTKAQLDSTLGIHPTSAEEFVTMREPVG